MLKVIISLFFLTAAIVGYGAGYSARIDAEVIAKFRRMQRIEAQNHAKVARQLVHQANWSSVGTISTHEQLLGYPMVNIISVDDSTTSGKSTGKIRFLLTDLDFTGPDWKRSNKVTFLFSDDQNLNCKHRGEDPMEPTCARAIISGQVIELNKDDPKYADALSAFVKRHPAATKWIQAHQFYLCELQIANIFVLDFYGGPHNVTTELYYKTQPDDNNVELNTFV